MGLKRTKLHRLPDHAQAMPLTVGQVASAYNFPTGVTGSGYTAGIVELGGGYSAQQVTQYFQQVGLPVPNFTAVSVDGGQNSQSGPDGADGEVQLDMIVAGSVAPGANFRIYFAGNTDQAFLDALGQAVTECNGVSVSWGAPETEWDPATMTQFAKVIAAARQRGVPVFVAAGDSGADDGTGSKVVDFPASAPDSVGCGGTRLTVNAQGQRSSEVVWDDNPTQSATGGGVSQQFPGRTVPDVAGNADPTTGYQVSIDGQAGVIGGTSAVAPLMLGLHALLTQANGGKPFDFVNVIAASPAICFDVTQGNNGGFKAGPGKDDVTGYGVPDGTRFLAALQASPAPAPPQPPSGGGGATFLFLAQPPVPPVPGPPVENPPGTPVPPGAPYQMTGTFVGTFIGTFTPSSGEPPTTGSFTGLFQAV